MSVRLAALVGVVFAALSLCLPNPPASAQHYPQRDLHIIDGHATGSGARDIKTARIEPQG